MIDAFLNLADTLVDDYDVIDFLHYLVERCIDLVDADEAGVMLASPSGQLQAVAASNERVRLLELFELQNRDGPCLDAYRTGEVGLGRPSRASPTKMADLCRTGDGSRIPSGPQRPDAAPRPDDRCRQPAPDERRGALGRRRQPRPCPG